jgi:hypothetical protein
MVVSPEQAVQTLRDIEETEARSRELHGYSVGSPHLILWGLVWIVAYGLTGLLPPHASLVWAVMILVGLTGSFVLAHGKAGFAGGWRYQATFFALFLFVAATYLVLPPTHPSQFGAFPPLVVATAYAIAGIWWLPRYLWLGALLFALTLYGFFFLKPWFTFWMAFGGGGGLILGGFWLRRA